MASDQFGNRLLSAEPIPSAHPRAVDPFYAQAAARNRGIAAVGRSIEEQGVLQRHAVHAMRVREAALVASLSRTVGAPCRVFRLESWDTVVMVFDVEVARIPAHEVGRYAHSEAAAFALLAERASAGWAAYPGEPIPDNVTLGSD